MYKHILVPTDGSRLSLKAVKSAVRVAAALGANLTSVFVIPPHVPTLYGDAMVYLPAKDRELAKKIGKKALSGLEQVARAAGVRCGSVMLASVTPWEGILKAAKAKRCDLIVMASHGRRGLTGLLMGSETTRVLTHSKIPVLVVR
jgi:nucleotide-binding universal stress UspA family protein